MRMVSTVHDTVWFIQIQDRQHLTFDEKQRQLKTINVLNKESNVPLCDKPKLILHQELFMTVTGCSENKVNLWYWRFIVL